MEEKDLIEVFLEDQIPLVRAEILKQRVSGVKSTPTELSEKLRKAFPGISADIIRKIESDPSFINDLITEHEASLLGDMKEIYQNVVERAKGEDVRFTKLYFDLLKNRIPQKSTTTNNILVTSKDPGELYAAFRRAAERLDSDGKG